MSLVDYCTTDRQREIIEALELHGSSGKVGVALGINAGTVRDIHALVRRRAADSGYTEHYDATRHVPAGHRLVGQSTYTKTDDGEPIWIKTAAEREEKKDQAIKSFIDEIAGSIPEIRPRKKPSDEPSEELCPVCVIGDAHIGMSVSTEITKERSFNSAIASQEIKEAVSSLVDSAPRSRQGVLINVGDFIHMDRTAPFAQTTKGTPVDTDGSLDYILRVACQTMIYAIDRFLDKVDKLEVVTARGNHDSSLAVAMQLVLEYAYKSEPRVHIQPCPSYYHILTWGKNLLAVHHGDKVRSSKLATILPRDYPAEYAAAKYRLWCIGHWHSMQVEEFDTCLVERFSALPPPDEWHSSKMYNSQHKTMTMFVLKESGGRQCTYTYQIDNVVKEPDARL